MALSPDIPDAGFLTRTRLRRTGGSLVMVVPAPARDLLDLAEGQEVLVSVEGGKVVMQPVMGAKGTRVRRPKYTLDQLVAGMETEPAAPTERDWMDAPPAGRETW